MADMAATILLVGVVVLLAAGAARQFGQLGPRGVLLDALAVLPQWKFFAQSAVANDAAVFEDLHLLVRTADDEWRPLLWPGERRWHEALWNPGQYARALLLEAMQALARQSDARETAHAALILARQGLSEVGGPMQLAIVATRGRGARVPELVWLSPWYRA